MIWLAAGQYRYTEANVSSNRSFLPSVGTTIENRYIGKPCSVVEDKEVVLKIRKRKRSVAIVAVIIFGFRCRSTTSILRESCCQAGSTFIFGKRHRFVKVRIKKQKTGRMLPWTG